MIQGTSRIAIAPNATTTIVIRVAQRTGDVTPQPRKYLGIAYHTAASKYPTTRADMRV